MYRILVIDDQDFKLDDICNQFNKDVVSLDTAINLLSSQQRLGTTEYDLILLDMTIKDNLSSNEFVGIDVLNYLEEIGSITPIILVTQFYNFKDSSASKGKNGFHLVNPYYKIESEYNFSSNMDIHYLPNMHEYLCQNFANYYGCILYVQNDSMWTESLKEMLKNLGGITYENFIIG